MREEHVRALAPSGLAPARRNAHHAAQLIADATRANLAPAPDYSHMALAWRSAGQGFGRLISEPFANGDRFALTFSPLRLARIDGASGAETAFALDGQSVEAARAWLDQSLAQSGGRPAAPVEPAAISAFAPQPQDAYAALGGWFALAATALERVADAARALEPGPSPVRCWPHHFDIAIYVALETGDPETARGVGVGMSSGDESVAEPYFYVSPWPAPPDDADAAAPAPGDWTRTGFVGFIAAGDALLNHAAQGALADRLEAFLLDSFTASRTMLGA